MVNYGLKDRVAIITGANNPWGIGAAAALAFAREGAKVVLIYKRVFRPFDATRMDRNGVDRYYGSPDPYGSGLTLLISLTAGAVPGTVFQGTVLHAHRGAGRYRLCDKGAGADDAVMTNHRITA